MKSRSILILLVLAALCELHGQTSKVSHAGPNPTHAWPRCSVYEAEDHVGTLAAVRGTVREVLRSPRGFAVLTFGGCYPDHVFSVVIADLRGFGNLRRFRGTTIEVAGVVRLFGGKPEIVIGRYNEILRLEAASDPTQGGMGGP